MYVVYKNSSSQCIINPPTTGTLATLYILEDQDTIYLKLPIISYNTHDKAPCDEQTLHMHLTTPLKLWEHELWHCIQAYAPEPTLKDHLQTGKHIILCSNAALDNAKFSTFSWLLHCDQTLWQGKGIIPGHVDDVYLGHSEAFGILTGTQFIANYVTHLPSAHQAKALTVTIVCDNKGMTNSPQ